VANGIYSLCSTRTDDSTPRGQAGKRICCDPLAAASEAELAEYEAGLDARVRGKVAAAVAGDGELDLFGKRLGDAGYRALAAHLRRHSGALPFTGLGHEQTNLTAAGAGMLFGALLRRGCPALKEVDVRLNPRLGARGLAHAVAALGPRLETIHFSRCGVGDGGFEAFAAAMPRLTGLKTVNAYGNGCGDAGARAMAAAVRGARGLEALWMSQNPAVGAAAAAELREAAAAAGVREYKGPEQSVWD
jgi:hypothetical protein